MLSVTENGPAFNFQHALAPFAQDADLPFATVLTDADVHQIFDDEQVQFGQTRHSFWTPALTVWAFLWQVLHPDKSCRQAVAHVVLFLALTGKPCELDTGLYCRARAKVPAVTLKRLAVLVGQRWEAATPEAWLWQGRHVKLVDGSTSQLPDTEANQQAFPQSSRQKQGLGFPLIRWVVLVSLATAVVQGLAYGPYTGKESGETALFRQLLDYLQQSDIVLADRYYCSYFMVALLQQQGVDVVLRLHQRRRYDFRRGQHVGPGDHVVAWRKPKRPAWLSEELYAPLPEQIRMREIYREVNQAGYRVRKLVIATTLLDATTYSADAVATLYSKRWLVELDIRALKTTLRMDVLACKTPCMVEREIWAHLLAYNLVRKVGAQVAALAEIHPRALSFQATKQAILAGWQQATRLQRADYIRLEQVMLKLLRKQKVGHRPGRCEPRAVKRRPKPHRLLTEPRRQARAKLLRAQVPKG